MRRKLSVILFALLGLALTGAHWYKIGNLEIMHPWARSSFGEANSWPLYLTLVNHGTEVDRLVAASAPGAKRVEFHAFRIEGGVAKMHPVKAIEVAPGQAVDLGSGGPHLMLVGLKAPMVEGENFPLTLTFEHAGQIEVQGTVIGW